jgi:ribosome maturation factor RimP
MNINELQDVIAPELKTLGFEIVKLEIVGSTRSPIVRLYIDRPTGVSIKDCAMVNRTIGMLLDQKDPFPGRYLLEVSSPGSDRPLTREEHYVRFTGYPARVQCVNTEAGKKTYTGSIRSCINGMLVLDTEDGQQLIRLEDVVKANLVAREYKIDKKQKQFKNNKGGRK